MTMVSQAIDQAGGLPVRDGQTVVLKPNLLTPLAACWSGSQNNSPYVNGVTTDWRVVKAVADLVRAKNPSGRILVMEGSTKPTNNVFQVMGYTAANFGSSVDQFIALEGSGGCNTRSTAGLVQRNGYYMDPQWASADVIISLPVLKTHGSAGITGAVKNLGIGGTPASWYSASNSASDCTRNYTNTSVSTGYIDHGATGLGTFIAGFYKAKPASFALMDGLQGLQNGPCSSSSSDRKNMRLLLASADPIALDNVATRIMNCDPAKVPHLQSLGGTDSSQITVVGNRAIADVKTSFKSGLSGVCQ